MTVATKHLAEFTMGVLRPDWQGPRVADFANGIDRVNAIADRSPGFVWRLGDDDMDVAQQDANGPLGGNPRKASTLSVWTDVMSLEHFVWNTVHKQFYDRGDEWFEPGQGLGQGLRMVLWWVPQGHRPSVADAMERFRHLEQHGDSEFAFSWAYVNDASLWRDAQCEHAA